MLFSALLLRARLCGPLGPRCAGVRAVARARLLFRSVRSFLRRWRRRTVCPSGVLSEPRLSLTSSWGRVRPSRCWRSFSSASLSCAAGGFAVRYLLVGGGRRLRVAGCSRVARVVRARWGRLFRWGVMRCFSLAFLCRLLHCRSRVVLRRCSAGGSPSRVSLHVWSSSLTTGAVAASCCFYLAGARGCGGGLFFFLGVPPARGWCAFLSGLVSVSSLSDFSRLVAVFLRVCSWLFWPCERVCGGGRRRSVV